MKVRAPGKLLIAGAYAVLDGASALVLAVDRYAIADGDVRAANPTPEVLAAIKAEEAPEVDASALRDGPHKLGLGSSAAMLVASLGVAYARAGRDILDREVRDALFADARRAHATVQMGGSGVDVAASVYGGVLDYAIASDGAPLVRDAALPSGVVLKVFWCGEPASTSAMRARVDDLRARNAGAYRARLDGIASASREALAAGARGDAGAFLSAIRDGADALLALGHDADAPIFPASTIGLTRLALDEDAAFVPSGAGGGDVFVHVGRGPASTRFVDAAAVAGLFPVTMLLDSEGVRVLP